MRTVINYTVKSEGRDSGKTFVITEMSASQGERWALKVLFALMKTDIQLPDTLSLAAVAEVGVRALTSLRWEEVEPLLDEMFDCIRIVPDMKNPNIIRALIESDIEEITTRLELRSEVLKMHLGFLKAVFDSMSTRMTATRTASAT